MAQIIDEQTGPRSLALQIAAILGQDLMFRRIWPGAPMRDAELCSRFGVSRPVIREALNHLAYLGQIENLPRKGARAVDCTPAELDDLISFHAAVFALACRFAAERRSDAQMHEIRDASEHLTRLAYSDAGAETYETARLDCYGTIERAVGPGYTLNRRRPFITRIWNPYAIDAVATPELRQASAERWKKMCGLIEAQDGDAAQRYFLAMVETTRPYMIAGCKKLRRAHHVLPAVSE